MTTPRVEPDVIDTSTILMHPNKRGFVHAPLHAMVPCTLGEAGRVQWALERAQLSVQEELGRQRTEWILCHARRALHFHVDESDGIVHVPTIEGHAADAAEEGPAAAGFDDDDEPLPADEPPADVPPAVPPAEPPAERRGGPLPRDHVVLCGCGCGGVSIASRQRATRPLTRSRVRAYLRPLADVEALVMPPGGLSATLLGALKAAVLELRSSDFESRKRRRRRFGSWAVGQSPDFQSTKLGLDGFGMVY